MGINEVWSWVETDKGKILDIGLKIAAETVRFSKQTGVKPCAVVSGEAKEEIGRLKRYGIRKVYVLEADDGSHPDVVPSLQGLSQLLAAIQPDHLLFAANSLGNEWAARLSIRFQAGVLGEIVDYGKSKGKLQLRKKAYGGNVHALFTLEGGAMSILTISLDALEKLEQPVEELEIVPFSCRCEQPRIVLQKVEPIHWSELSLHEADFVIGVGRGVTKEGMRTIQKLAEKWNCPIGGSKVADESGLITREFRIGASGKNIACHIYLAIGISGAPHHLAGIKEVKHLVVINPETNAPITENAELVIAMDFEKVIPFLLEMQTETLEVVS
ncbi:electron transfer flavoprotein subunit alpha/FixB family protein [Brevibacillus sp. NRS-1366]|uniref:electron transfer flavoprotein subunit alpha/FixB family protein n=1 Tax=Brevibacillus sp. NRS-1366 TaxID=3233899 RepID=UPI003D1A9C43